jgi:hypothetical protein
MSTQRQDGGDGGTRTRHLMLAKHPLYQMSYVPTEICASQAGRYSGWLDLSDLQQHNLLHQYRALPLAVRVCFPRRWEILIGVVGGI